MSIDNIPYGQYIYLIWLQFRKISENYSRRSVQACMAGLEQPDSAVLLLSMVAGRIFQGCCGTDRGKEMAGEAKLLYYKCVYIYIYIKYMYIYI